MKMQFQKYIYIYITDSRKSKYESTEVLLQSFYFTQKFALLSIGDFHKHFLIVTCCTLGRFEFRTLTPNRLKYQTGDILKLL